MKINIGKSIIAVATLAVLTGCDAGTDIINPEVAFTFNEGFDQTRLVESGAIPFRTYQKPEKGEGKTGPEIAGARCTMKSKEFSAKFVTPAKAAIPVIKGKPSSLEVTCIAGDKKKTLYQEPFKPQTVVIGDPVATVIGTMAGAIVTATSKRWYYVYGSETIRFVFD